MNRRSTRGDDGYTIVELLVVLLLLGFNATAMSAGMQFGTRVWERSESRISASQTDDTAQTALRNLLSSATPRIEDGFVRFHGEPNYVAFDAAPPPAFGASGMARMEISLAPGERGSRPDAQGHVADRREEVPPRRGSPAVLATSGSLTWMRMKRFLRGSIIGAIVRTFLRRCVSRRRQPTAMRCGPSSSCVCRSPRTQTAISIPSPPIQAKMTTLRFDLKTQITWPGLVALAWRFLAWWRERLSELVPQSWRPAFRDLRPVDRSSGRRRVAAQSGLCLTRRSGVRPPFDGRRNA